MVKENRRGRCMIITFLCPSNETLIWIIYCPVFLQVQIFNDMNSDKVNKERGFNNARKYSEGFWLHSRAKKTGA